MKTLTIRGLPDDVHARLKEQAKKNRRSLNQEVIAELCNEQMEQDDFVIRMLALSDDAYTGVEEPLSPAEIEAAMVEMRNK